ncbi:MAG: ATP-binding protein [Dehalococcoidia bacterium]|nr:ATP-binding protein [Dehalococcoidia bacterium]
MLSTLDKTSQCDTLRVTDPPLLHIRLVSDLSKSGESDTEDRAVVRENAIKMLKGQSGSAYEYRSIRKNGEIRVVLETVAGVAHEINNPLTAIYAISQLLVEEAEDEDSREDFQIIQKQTQRVIEIVRNLLSFARKYESNKAAVSVNRTIEDTIKLRAHDLAMGNIEIVCHFDPGLPDAMADGNQLQQVFLNLINNAYDAMKEDHKKGALTISTQAFDGHIRIAFADDGPGIPCEVIDRIFEPFFTTKDVGKGTGLGLSICYGIIKEHGGEIRAESVPGNGAIFTIDLPLVAASSRVEPELEQAGRRK